MLIQNVTNSVPTSGFVSDTGASQAAAKPAPAPKAAPVQQPTEDQLKGAVEALNRAMKQNNANVEFSIDKDTKQTIIKVVELGSGNVIRQFPSEEILAVSRMIAQAQQGVLLKQQA